MVGVGGGGGNSSWGELREADLLLCGLRGWMEGREIFRGPILGIGTSSTGCHNACVLVWGGGGLDADVQLLTGSRIARGQSVRLRQATVGIGIWANVMELTLVHYYNRTIVQCADGA